MLATCLMLLVTHYAKNYVGVIGGSLSMRLAVAFINYIIVCIITNDVYRPFLSRQTILNVSKCIVHPSLPLNLW